MSPTLVVCGSDTGVGKTWVSCQLLSRWAPQVAACKPFETGCSLQADGNWEAADATALRRAAKMHDDAPPTAQWMWPQPVAPVIEQARLGVSIREGALREAVAQATHDRVACLVETAGGAASPLCRLDDGRLLTSVDLAVLLDAPVLLVVEDRLGAIHQAAAAWAWMQQRGARGMGIVLNARERVGPDDNAAWIQSVLGTEVPVWRLQGGGEGLDALASTIRRIWLQSA